jgi:hypothetical protein
MNHSPENRGNGVLIKVFLGIRIRHQKIKFV